MNTYTEINTNTQDNIKIAMNFYENKFSNEVVIIAPGWCMTKDSKVFKEISGMFAKNYNVITFDFRGHGKSKGFYTFSAKEIFDIDSVIKFAQNKNFEKINLVGFSLGAAVILIAASKYRFINKAIAVSAPSEFGRIENRMWKKAAWFETLKKFELDRFLSIRHSIIPYKKIKPIDIVDNINCPTLFIAGSKDPTVYAWHTKILYEKAICEKEFKLFEDGFHAEDLYLYYKNEFSDICNNWLNKKEVSIN